RLWAAMGHAPNAWPPHQYIVMNAMRTLSGNGLSRAIPQAEGEIWPCTRAGRGAMVHQFGEI
ncbi:hypothetical protein BGW80DRAFT_1362014, partial [Lactifluus volemus]